MLRLLELGKERYALIAVIALLLFFILISASSVQRKYLTVDESVYIASGYSYLKTGDYRLNAEHPMLGKAINAIPLLLLNPVLPLDKPNWEKSKTIGEIGANYGFAADFYEANLAGFFSIVFSARMIVLALSVFMAVLVFLWSRELFGVKAGLLSLFLFAFAPNIIAHSRLATLDMPLTVFVFASFYFAHVFARSGKMKFLGLSALFIALAALTKYAALVFFPLLFLFIAFHHRQLSKNKKAVFREKNLLLYYAFTFAVLVIVLLVLASIVYSFDNYSKPNYFGIIPARMLDGFNFIHHWVSSGRQGYLFGEFRDFIPEYFLAAFLMKSTIPFIALLIASFYFFARKPEPKAASLLVPALGFFIIASLFSRFYLGLRYILPCFPFLFVFCGILLSDKRDKIVSRDKRLLAVFVILLCVHAVSSLLIYPHYLAYFNELIGPENAIHYLSDSNLDWGQDLYYFQDFVKAHGIKRVNFIYFGWPFYGAFFPEAHYSPSCKPIEGNIAISATYLVGRNSKEHECYKWLRERKPIARIGYSIYFYEIS